MKNLCWATLALSLFVTPALAQRGGRSNRGAAVTGHARANQVQTENKNPSTGSKAEKTRTREGWEKKAKHNAKGKDHSK